MRFIETPVFTRAIIDLMDDDAYQGLQLALILRPGLGPIIGTGGIRMKRGDFDNLTKSIREAGAIRRGEQKPSRITELAPVDVKAIRRRIGKSQAQFAHMIGVSVATLQNWEQGRRRPHGPARALLKVAAENPKAVSAALSK